MATIIVDGKNVEISDSARLNGVQVARMVGVEIPHYCWHAGLSVVASCRMCLVETGTRNPDTGAISMMPKLVPACQTPAKDGTVFVTDSEKIRQSRAQVEEALLIDHPIDCPICDKAGECRLQDYHFEHGQRERRADIKPFTSRRREMGDTVTLFVDRCVMCTRCVRFCREVAGTSELMVINRGSNEEIDVVPGYPLANKLSGNVVDLCPVGALGDRDFLYSQRVWFMRKHAHVCGGCSTGCSIDVDENQDHVYRLRPRENPFVNQFWMCDEGRYGFHYVHDEKRKVGARRREGASYVNVDWSKVANELPAKLESAARLAGVISPHWTVEEAYLFAKYLRSVDPQAVLALGHVPVEGVDERFPTGFTIHAEKCPNRRGVEEVLRHFTGECLPLAKLIDELESRSIGGIWLGGGYPHAWMDDATAKKLTASPLVIVQDLFDSPAWNVATYQLPGTAFVEHAGSFVNHANRLQSFDWSIRPPAGVWTEASLLWRLLGRKGMYNPRAALSQLAEEVPYFSAAREVVGETGIDLSASAPPQAAAAAP